MFEKLKEYKVEVASIAVILLNTMIITRDLKQIKAIKRGQKMIIFK